MSENSIYTEDEQRILSKILNTRVGIIDKMTEGGVPEKVGEIRVLNEVLNSTDKAVVDAATLRIKHNDAQSNAAMAGMALAMIKEARANRANIVGGEVVPELPSELQHVETVDGEMDINPERLVPEEFVPPTFDATKIDS